MSEYSLTKGNKIDYHTFPSGATVIKAFTADDCVFFDKRGHKVKLPHHPSAVQISALEKRIVKVAITWCFQKNRQNNEKRNFSAETPSNVLICPVQAAMRMVFRARRLGQLDNLPVAVYRKKTSFFLCLHYRVTGDCSPQKGGVPGISRQIQGGIEQIFRPLLSGMGLRASR